MYRSRLSTVSKATLSVLILAASFACKSKTEKKPSSVEATKRSVQALLDVPQDVIYAASVTGDIVFFGPDAAERLSAK